MTIPKSVTIKPDDALWPKTLTERLGGSAPTALQAIGPVALLSARKTALFCSARTPGDAILRAQDTARRLRDEGVTVISGFHSPIEKECLLILLRGKQPIIICPARAIETMRLPTECRAAFEAGRVLFLSPFPKQPKRVTKESALRRNEVVAALADQVFIAHITPDGQTERMAAMCSSSGACLSFSRPEGTYDLHPTCTAGSPPPLRGVRAELVADFRVGRALILARACPVLDTGDWPGSSAKEGVPVPGFRTIRVRNDDVHMETGQIVLYEVRPTDEWLPGTDTALDRVRWDRR